MGLIVSSREFLRREAERMDSIASGILPPAPGSTPMTAVPPKYLEHHRRLVDYLKMKVEQADWHGVADAANDLRELEAHERGRQSR